LQFFNKLF